MSNFRVLQKEMMAASIDYRTPTEMVSAPKRMIDLKLGGIRAVIGHTSFEVLPDDRFVMI